MSYDVSPGDAARALGVTTVTLARWADEGRITCVTSTGGHRRYHAGEIRAHAEVQTWREVAYKRLKQLQVVEAQSRRLSIALAGIQNAITQEAS
ncbi:MerR family DNA-binding transcriptional regulator [Enterococcus hirae]|uniref:MerR family DNA-binding transcriptional regulator n=1 Tax=Enterococcus hirae TaxID=1354 RepID=UPI00136807B0|nr:MerR family DNA-binding transcriptional regulator [Enterococcus hirae]